MIGPMIPLDWCIKKLEEALADYDMSSARDYLELIKLWKDKAK